MLLLILPICFLPFLEHQKFNSYLVVGVILYVISITVYSFFYKAASHTLAATRPVNLSFDILRAVPLNSCAFSAHYNFMNLYRELRDRRGNGARSVYVAIPVLLAMFLVIGLAGYFSLQL